MIWSILSLAFIGLAMFGVVGALLYGVHLAAEWHFALPARPAHDPIRKCLGCGDGYHESWDNPAYDPLRPETGGKDFWNGGLCPNSSGAD